MVMITLAYFYPVFCQKTERQALGKESKTNAEAFASKATWPKLASQFLSIAFKTVKLNIIATEPPKIH
jgi:hypothetical protein